MAKKLKLMSLFQELGGRAQLTNRRPTPSSAGVYLMQLRSKSGVAVLPRRRFMISVGLTKAPLAPLPVKINHLPAPSPSAISGARATAVGAQAHPHELPQVQPKAG